MTKRKPTFKLAVFIYRLCFTVALAFTFAACTAPVFGNPINWGLLVWVAPLVIFGRGTLYLLGGV